MSAAGVSNGCARSSERIYKDEDNEYNYNELFGVDSGNIWKAPNSEWKRREERGRRKGRGGHL